MGIAWFITQVATSLFRYEDYRITNIDSSLKSDNRAHILFFHFSAYLDSKVKGFVPVGMVTENETVIVFIQDK